MYQIAMRSEITTKHNLLLKVIRGNRVSVNPGIGSKVLKVTSSNPKNRD